MAAGRRRDASKAVARRNLHERVGTAGTSFENGGTPGASFSERPAPPADRRAAVVEEDEAASFAATSERGDLHVGWEPLEFALLRQLPLGLTPEDVAKLLLLTDATGQGHCSLRKLESIGLDLGGILGRLRDSFRRRCKDASLAVHPLRPMLDAAEAPDAFGCVSYAELASNPALLAPVLAPEDFEEAFGERGMRPGFLSASECARLLYCLDPGGLGRLSLPLLAHVVTDVSDVTAGVAAAYALRCHRSFLDRPDPASAARKAAARSDAELAAANAAAQAAEAEAAAAAKAEAAGAASAAAGATRKTTGGGGGGGGGGGSGGLDPEAPSPDDLEAFNAYWAAAVTEGTLAERQAKHIDMNLGAAATAAAVRGKGEGDGAEVEFPSAERAPAVRTREAKQAAAAEKELNRVMAAAAARTAAEEDHRRIVEASLRSARHAQRHVMQSTRVDAARKAHLAPGGLGGGGGGDGAGLDHGSYDDDHGEAGYGSECSADGGGGGSFDRRAGTPTAASAGRSPAPGRPVVARQRRGSARRGSSGAGSGGAGFGGAGSGGAGSGGAGGGPSSSAASALAAAAADGAGLRRDASGTSKLGVSIDAKRSGKLSAIALRSTSAQTASAAARAKGSRLPQSSQAASSSSSSLSWAEKFGEARVASKEPLSWARSPDDGDPAVLEGEPPPQPMSEARAALITKLLNECDRHAATGNGTKAAQVKRVLEAKLITMVEPARLWYVAALGKK